MKPIFIVFSLIFVVVLSWQSGSGTKENQQATNEAFRINAQLDQWENSHILPQKPTKSTLANQTQTQLPEGSTQYEAPNEVDEEKIAKAKNQIFEERKKFAQEWVDKKNSESTDDKVKYFVNSMGKVDFIVNKKATEKSFDNIEELQAMEM